MIAYHDIEGDNTFRCPQCGHDEGMVAVRTIGVAIYPDGEMEPDPEVHVCLEDECDCNLCDYTGTVGDFIATPSGSQEEPEAATVAVSDVGDNVVRLRPV